MALVALDHVVLATELVDVPLVASGEHITARCDVSLVTPLAVEAPSPDGAGVGRIERAALVSRAVAVGGSAGSVSRWRLAGKVVRVTNIAGIPAEAAVEIRRKHNVQSTMAGAGGMGKGGCFCRMVGMALAA